MCGCNKARNEHNAARAAAAVAAAAAAAAAAALPTVDTSIWGPPLWNDFVGDASLAFVSAGFYIVIYADDLNAFKGYDRRTANTVIFNNLRSRRGELHEWGRANQATFDASKEHVINDRRRMRQFYWY